jgi:hypothetical protein
MKNYIAFIIGALCISLNLQGQFVAIPDANFKNKLLTTQCSDSNGDGIPDYHADLNSDGQIDITEAHKIIRLDIPNAGIDSLDGINNFINLTYLKCNGNHLSKINVNGCAKLNNLECNNNQLSEINVNGLVQLKNLECSNNQITQLNINGLTKLESVGCNSNQVTQLNVNECVKLKEISFFFNQLTNFNIVGSDSLLRIFCNDNLFTNLDVDKFTNLTQLICDNNQLTQLDVSKLTHLLSLDCHNNQLTQLDVTKCVDLFGLICCFNQLTQLDVSKCTALYVIDCSNNQLTQLDLSKCIGLSTIHCTNNNLYSFSLKNNIKEDFIDFSGNPNLAYICSDEVQINSIKQQTLVNGQNTEVNSYCSFVPEGDYYTLSGNIRYDSNNNGCDGNDLYFGRLKLNISDLAGANGTLIPNESGNYQLPLHLGTHTITPQIENPNYFSISPTSLSVNLPSDSNNLVHDFCILPNGEHHDVEACVLFSTVARPGFDANYKIFYKNKGNQVESGDISFLFNDAKLTIENISQVPSSQSIGELHWTFDNLLPFEEREINLSFKINSPADNPSVNAGDLLNFKINIQINSAINDEMPSDNECSVVQTVVGAIDPNDKTCMEGNTISPLMVGKFLHYLIRFENTGTYEAENIVVRDSIDEGSFDLSSLQLTNSSHDCYTRISGNKVEFIFENINLPFVEPNKHGFLAYKIKTKPNISIGHSIRNNADIYFDFNLPIRTNTTNTIVALPVKTNAPIQITPELALYPNPSFGELHINCNQIIERIEVSDALGRILLQQSEGTDLIDLSRFPSGHFQIRVIGQEGWVIVKQVSNQD